MKKEFKLTEEQRGFAADNHEVLMKFLEDKKLPFDEFYDVVVFGYLYAVKLYDESDEQNKSEFEFVAREHMQNELNSYYAKQREQNQNVRVLSLDYTVSFKDGLTAGDVIADSNVNVSDDVCRKLSRKNYRLLSYTPTQSFVQCRAAQEVYRNSNNKEQKLKGNKKLKF